MAYFSLRTSLLCRLSISRLHVAISAGAKRCAYRSLSSARADDKPDGEKQRDFEHVCSQCVMKFDSVGSLSQHLDTHHRCHRCQIFFTNKKSLEMHIRTSALHNERVNECVGAICKKRFVSHGDMTLHAESGACPSGIDRRRVNDLAIQHDVNSVITNAARLALGAKQSKLAATEASWNGEGYECPLCYKVFGTLTGIEAHLQSPVHVAKGYHCPPAHHGCGREFKTLSGLLHHVERSECGVARFASQVKSSLQDITSKLRKN